MRSNGFRNLCVKMRLADSGFDMDAKLIGLFFKTDAKLILLAPKASISQVYDA